MLNNPVAIIVLQAARLVPDHRFMQNFVDAVPIAEPMEATEVDGATRWQTFALIILPLIKPGFAAAAVLSPSSSVPWQKADGDAGGQAFGRCRAHDGLS